MVRKRERETGEGLLVGGLDAETGTFEIAVPVGSAEGRAAARPGDKALHDMSNAVAIIAVDVSFLKDRLTNPPDDVQQALSELSSATERLCVLLEEAKRR